MPFLYSFVLEKTVKDLRAISKSFKLRIRNRIRAELLSGLLLYFPTKSFEDTSIGDCLSNNDELKAFLQSKKDEVIRRATLSTLPEVRAFDNMVHFTDHKLVMKLILDYKAEDPGSGFPLTAHSQVEHNDPSFIINEFARLIVNVQDE
ncbi:hypothetical protein BWQ96_00953 [Gracilariopsis chorda]|uniref:Uncharacterized protein n=1 Tax=Gracilariopsis chorda TaxID=448386 RepID=A0A2V3J456_9FLOR|nr:hypothetical protein BWQ96_00953 [Gracilariopsis chorda]|eukprot:PXF49164.1 hypothetical protein BWQ96_00953 [Gracilariopsis chorda]